MKLHTTLTACVAAMILAATSAGAANIGVDQTVDLTNAGSFNGNYINGYETIGVFSSPFLVDISVGDNVTLSFTFAGNEEVTTQGLYSANVSVWTQGWNDYATVYSTGSLSFLDSHGNVVYSSGTKSDSGCCVHVGQFFFGDLSGAPSTMTFHAMKWTGTVTGYDGFTTRTYDDPNLLIGADSVTLTGSASGTSAAPEPTSWAMMLGGFGLVGSALRRRKVRIALA